MTRPSVDGRREHVATLAIAGLLVAVHGAARASQGWRLPEGLRAVVGASPATTFTARGRCSLRPSPKTREWRPSRLALVALGSSATRSCSRRREPRAPGAYHVVGFLAGLAVGRRGRP
jgi:hypothetical protein